MSPPPGPLRRAVRALRRSRWDRQPFSAFPPFSFPYVDKRDRLLDTLAERVRGAASLDDTGLLGDPLLAGVDERPVEYGWVLHRLAAMAPVDRALDVGCVLNYPFCADAVRRVTRERQFLNLVTEPLAYPEGSSMLVGDMREPPVEPTSVDLVTCLSTLEHVGMDNERFGTVARPSSRPLGEMTKAVTAMLDLLRPGGRLLVTVPYGTHQDLGWMLILDDEDLAAVFPAGATVERFGVTNAVGWVRIEAGAPPRGSYGSGTAAAHAVACVTYDRPT
jgi:hypothetical protein